MRSMNGHNTCLLASLALIQLIDFAHAGGPRMGDRDLYGEPCFNAAKSSLQSQLGCEDSLECLCRNSVFMSTVGKCINDFSPSEELTARAYQNVAFSCNNMLNQDTLLHANITYSAKELDSKLILENLKSKEIRNYNYWVSHVFGGCLLAYVGIIILFRTFSNIAFKLWSGTWFYLMLNSKYLRLWQRKVILPASYSFRGISLRLPTRFRLITITLYIAANIVLLGVDYHLILPNYKFIGKNDQLGKYVADRSGILAVSQLPLLFLFGGRNNFMLYCTGWNMDSFNLWHKWIGRVVIAELIIHGICHSSVKIMTGRYGIAMQQPFWIWGVCGLVFAGVIAFQSLSIFRSRCYETFLVLHFVLVLLFMISAWKHIQHVPLNLKYLFASGSLWAADRLIRVLRILRFLLMNSKKGNVTKAIARSAGESNDGQIIEVEVRLEVDQWRYFTGSFAFLHFALKPYWLWAWQSHPFSVLSHDDGKSLIFFIKKRRGITSELYEQLQDKSLQSGAEVELRIPVLLEGPYGHYQPLNRYNNVLLVAGGIGITTIAAYANHLQEEHVKLTLHDKCRLERIVLVWIVSDLKPLARIANGLNGLKNVDIHIYVTQDTEPRETSSEGNGGVISDISDLNTLNEWEKCQNIFPAIHLGKPSLTRYVEREIEVAGNRPLAVMACGPGSINEEIRATICRSKSSNCVDYYEEAFSW